MSEQRRTEDALLDLFLYVPLGAAVVLRQHWAQLADLGRREAEQRSTTARMVGEFAVKAARREVERRLADLNARRSSSTASTTAASTPDHSPVVSVVADATSNSAADGIGATTVVEPAGTSVVDADTLPIEGYDGLTAAQIVERLAGLTPQQLQAVRRYEASGRHRRTVLGRIDQLAG